MSLYNKLFFEESDLTIIFLIIIRKQYSYVSAHAFIYNKRMCTFLLKVIDFYHLIFIRNKKK